jgi:hypothetical protein
LPAQKRIARRLVGFPQDRSHLLFGESTLLHGLLAGRREPFSQITIDPKNLGRSAGRQLAVYVFPVPDLENRHLTAPVIDEVNDPVAALAYPVAIGIAGEFLCALRSGTIRESSNTRDDPMTVGFAAYCIKFPGGRALDQQPISGHAASSPG